MAVPRIGGSGTNLPNPGLYNNAGAVGLAPFTSGFFTGFTNTITLGAGEVFNIPSGSWWVYTGPYTFLQYYDPITGIHKTRPCASQRLDWIESDGTNFRLANLTGCVIGAVITSGGNLYPTNGIGTTNGVTCSASSGSSTWQTIVGGAVSLTLATSTGTTTAGTGYNYPPICVIDAPPSGGLQATAIVTSLSAGGVPVANVQVINQGAGYTSAPKVTFIPDPREATATTPGPATVAAVVLTLTATGQLTGLYPTNHGSALTGVPTLSFAGTSATTSAATATAIMNFTVTGVGTYTTGGSSLGSLELVSVSNTIAASVNFLTNPLHNGVQVTFPRPARISATLASGVASSTTGSTFEDAGLGLQQIPSMVPVYSITSTTAVVPQPGTPTVGGQTDTSYLQAS